MIYFFFSSRRRHTRWNCDWSSDVCSSDLATPEHAFIIEERLRTRGLDAPACRAAGRLQVIDAAVALEQFMIGEEPDWGRFLSEVGGAVARGIASSTSGRVRAYGEMVDLLW